MLLAAATLALPMIDEAHDPRLVEFNAELRRAEREIASSEHAAMLISKSHGVKLPGFDGLLDALTSGRTARKRTDAAAPPAAANRTAAANTSACDAATTAEQSYGVLDLTDAGTLVLMQAVAPFETRRDLALGANVDCDALRARIRAVFSAGMDLDVVVKVHRERGRRRDDCVVAIVQELDDKK